VFIKRIVLISGFLGIFLGGCSSKNNPTQSPVEKSGSISFRISIAADSPFKKIAKKAELNISAPDMITITKLLEIKDSTIEGTVNNIPSGKERKFEVRVFDSTGTERYKGSVSGNIKADSTVSITLPISRIVGSATINGTVNEVPPSWTIFDGFEDSTLNSKWKPYAGSAGKLSIAKYHTGTKSFEVTFSDFKYIFDKPLTNGQISWWYYDNSGTPWSYFYILTDTSKTDLTLDNLYMNTQNASQYYFQFKANNITTINRVPGWRNFTATISAGTLVFAVDGQTGITVNGSAPVIGFQIAGGIMDDFSVESNSN
jgi:hypothetical protein